MTKQEVLRQLAYHEGALNILDVCGEFEAYAEELATPLNQVYHYVEENVECQKN